MKEEVHFTAKLEKDKTAFFPFNRGFNGGKGNPPEADRIKTKYLWESIWSKNSVLDLIQNFIHEFEDKESGEKKLIFPRYHQLKAVRELLRDARKHGAGNNYLIQHSAGSGKTFTMSWLAHQLTSLFDEKDERVFDSIILITDRRNLDRQLQDHVRQFEKTPGLVAAIDIDSHQLAEAMKRGKQIIVTTQQKFPYIVDEISELPANNFALIIDEAHSGQTGETRRQINEVLATSNLDEAEQQDKAGLEEDLEDKIVAEMKKRGRLPNVSSFAFTATPKPKTREMFGTRNKKGGFEPFSIYSMRQAIEERFILDVLQNYTTYQHYFHLIKNIEDDPLSKIIEEINERYGTNFTEDDKAMLKRIEEKIHDNHALKKQIELNPPENARLAFDEYVKEQIQMLVENNLKLYKKINDDMAVQESLLYEWFQRFRESLK